MASVFKRNGGGKYVARWFDHEGKRRQRSTKTTDKRTAERIAARWEADSLLRAEGVIDPRADKWAAAEARPIAQHCEDFVNALAAQNVTFKRIAGVRQRLARLCDAAGADRLSDLTPARVMDAIKVLRDEGLGLCTAHNYLLTVKQFSRWLDREGRTRGHTLSHLKGFNFATDRRYQRRVFLPDEVSRLVHAAEHGGAFCGLGGPDRAMLYRLAAGTGFRSAELASLTTASFDLNAVPPTATVEASFSKRRRRDTQPLRSDLAAVLRPWLATKPSDRPVFKMPEKTAKMVRRDLEAARAVWIAEGASQAERAERSASDFLCPVDGAGRVADFHAFRHSFITAIVASGASAKVAQELARHSTPALTLGLYTHTRLHDLTGALEGLPPIMDAPRPTEREALRATGTDHYQAQFSREGCHHGRHHTEQDHAREDGTGREAVRVGGHAQDTPNTLRFSDLRDDARQGGTNRTKPLTGLEPATRALQKRCSTN